MWGLYGAIASLLEMTLSWHWLPHVVEREWWISWHLGGWFQLGWLQEAWEILLALIGLHCWHQLLVMIFFQCDWTLCFLVGIEILSWYEPFPWAYLLGVGFWCFLCDNKVLLDLHMAEYPWLYLLQGLSASGMTFYKGLAQRALGMQNTCWLWSILSIRWDLFLIAPSGLEYRQDRFTILYLMEVWNNWHKICWLIIGGKMA